MKNKMFIIPFVLAVLTLFLAGFTSAAEISVDGTLSTTLSDVVLGPNITMAGVRADTVPVRVTFRSLTDESDVKVKVWIEGFRSDVSSATSRFNVVNGSTYTKLLSLGLPNDMKDTTEVYTLHVSISSPDKYDSAEYTVKLQRDSYSYEVLSVDFDSTVSAGKTFPVSVVVRNNGFERNDDNYVVVSIDELGVSAKGYFGDLIPTESCGNNCENEEDSMQKTLYLTLPENTRSGVYTLSVRAYNKDASVSETKMIKVDASTSSKVVAAIKNQEIGAGETKVFDLILINSGNSIKVYDIQTNSGSGLQVSAPSVVTVGSGASATVPVSVTVPRTTAPGSYTFTVDVGGEQVVLGVNVTKGSTSSSVVALTAVLVIVFVVLLIVLVIMLTRKGKSTEEVETSYY